ncbi:acyltransferase family protein [Sphingomonas quercus]|uniref:Acyltransferase family protein n=1 Tax=Sphingomonas quercus TaxID=2842451 RepID=A0ABS6BIX4_9SPHN|nr:acyltransferase family protein [Sphingomonas quercus]
MNSSSAAAAGSQRIHGIDAWRGLVLAMLGIAFHSVDALGSGMGWTLIKEGIHVFRMETFFAIAGFLAFLANDRPGWVKKRAALLLVPFAFTALAVIGVRTMFSEPARWWAETDHLWFLPVLMLCAFLPRRALPLWQIGVAAILLSPFMLIHVPVWKAAIYPLWITGLITAPYYAVFYLAGQAIAAGTIRLGRVHMWLAIAAFAAWIALLIVAPGVLDDPAASIVVQLVRTTVALLVMLGIFQQALGVRRISWPVPELSRASYTIYLVHYPVTVGLQNAVMMLAPGYRGWAGFALICGATLAICLIVHFGMVARRPLAAFLLNGRPLPRPVFAPIGWPRPAAQE